MANWRQLLSSKVNVTCGGRSLLVINANAVSWNLTLHHNISTETELVNQN